MIIEEYKSESCLIRFEDKAITTEENNKEIIKIILSIFINKIERKLR